MSSLGVSQKDNVYQMCVCVTPFESLPCNHFLCSLAFASTLTPLCFLNGTEAIREQKFPLSSKEGLEPQSTLFLVLCRAGATVLENLKLELTREHMPVV